MTVNCCSWFGESFKEFGGKIDGNEEDFLAVNYPAKTKKYNVVCGEALVVHFAYAFQRRCLGIEKIRELISEYKKLVPLMKFDWLL